MENFKILKNILIIVISQKKITLLNFIQNFIQIELAKYTIQK